MSSVYRLFFIVLLITVAAPAAAQAEPERHYRVELLVVRHLAGSSDSTPQQQLQDLTEVLDLYAPVDDSATEGKPATEPEPQAPASTVPAEPLSPDALEPEKPLATPVDEMSDTMREAWRRLRGSAGFRPELFRAWEQSGDEPFPALRIHDDELLFEIEPDALLDSLPTDEHGARVFSDQTLQQQQDSTTLSPKGSMEEDAEPPPIEYYYRIDGTARLTRSRYLHLDLDIELREPLYGLQQTDQEQSGQAIAVESGTASTAGSTHGDEQPYEVFPGGAPAERQKIGPAAEATAFRIHQIDQSRQVKTEQMEYFDGPVIGVLALVTGFDVFPEENATDSATSEAVGGSTKSADPARDGPVD